MISQVAETTKGAVSGLVMKTATKFRINMEANSPDEPYENALRTAALAQHAARLTYWAIVGVELERVVTYGAPATYYAKERHAVPAGEQQAALFDLLSACLPKERVCSPPRGLAIGD